jgi:hypothetical protein
MIWFTGFGREKWIDHGKGIETAVADSFRLLSLFLCFLPQIVNGVNNTTKSVRDTTWFSKIALIKNITLNSSWNDIIPCQGFSISNYHTKSCYIIRALLSHASTISLNHPLVRFSRPTMRWTLFCRILRDNCLMWRCAHFTLLTYHSLASLLSRLEWDLALHADLQTCSCSWSRICLHVWLLQSFSHTCFHSVMLSLSFAVINVNQSFIIFMLLWPAVHSEIIRHENLQNPVIDCLFSSHEFSNSRTAISWDNSLPPATVSYSWFLSQEFKSGPRFAC